MTKQEKIQALKRVLRLVRGEFFGKFRCYDGLCGVVAELWWQDKISLGQERFLTAKIDKLPKITNGMSRDYAWEYGLKEPRIKWLEKQIKRLEK